MTLLFRIQHLFAILLLIAIGLFLFTGRPAPLAPTLSFCPWTTQHKHIPTLLLRGDSSTHREELRTTSLEGPFLPSTYPPRDLRLAQQPLDASWHSREHGAEEGTQLCKVYDVPSSPAPVVPKSWRRNGIMFGMSTTPDRILFNMPIWEHWIPRSRTAVADVLPLLLILTPETDAKEEARRKEALEEADAAGMRVEIRDRPSDRFETRYFGLVEEMWGEARKREKWGVVTEWFVFMDDDTFYPDYDSVVRMLGEHDSSKDVLIGGLSESTKQVAQWGRDLAYGGAGIFISRSLMGKMNREGTFQACLSRYGAAFGGDAMVSACAALSLSETLSPSSLLTLDPTLHQLDIRGDSTGFFQSGFLITSLHHWGSWFTLFPPWHESGSGDIRKGIALVGRAAKAVGGDNWGRRSVWEGGKVVVSLGYSVVLHAVPVSREELGKSEHTWWEFETFHPMRAAREEGREKRTYYVTGVKELEKGVVRLEHKNREGEKVDVIWDGRLGKRA